jgi:hypothetical protein
MAMAVDGWGWGFLIATRLLVMAAILLVTVLTLMRGRATIASALVAMIVSVALAAAIQDRPQTISFLFLSLLAAACQRLMRRQPRPSLWLVALGSLVWAQLHGLWVLGPVAFALVTAGLFAEDRSIRSPDVRAAASCFVVAGAGVLNPQGPRSFILPWRFREATGVISEWLPTSFSEIVPVTWGLILVLTWVAWARSSRTVPISEIVWVMAWSALGTQAFRNVAPSLILTAPMTVTALQRARSRELRSDSRTGVKESRILATAVAATILAGAGVLTTRLVTIDPLADARALAIARWVAQQPGPLRIFNDYNTSGPLVGFSAGNARLVVDGRADMWGTRYIEDTGSVQALERGWEERLAAFRPDAIVSAIDSPLAQLLTRENAWRVELRDQKYELLVPVPGHSDGR